MNEMNGGLSANSAIGKVFRQSTIPKSLGSRAEVRMKILNATQKKEKLLKQQSPFQKYASSLTPQKRRLLRKCTDRAAEILRKEAGPFTNASDAARTALGEARNSLQRIGLPQASPERIDFATRLICSQLGQRYGAAREAQKPEQWRLRFW
ncbi:hypothetical protein IID26_03345 [Patescibacteria group bacterium]|nr:hypothetical protein [Patescibacteria group bacterium]